MRVFEQGRRVVVSGAARGIGRAIALAFARKGDRLVLLDRDGDRLAQVVEVCRSSAREVYPVMEDVGDPAGACAGVKAALEAWDGLDVLVNNAGILTQAACV